MACVVISGHVDDQFSACREEMRAWNIKNDVEKVEYKTFNATLVEAGRDEAISHALQYKYQWALQIDADMLFPPDTLTRLLEDAYVKIPFADAVGAYCQLKAEPYLPTIDTGSGTWETIYPGCGVVEAIRTGAACLLTKTSLFSRFGPPWFRVRFANRPLDALLNVDNFARCKFGGRNPFAEVPEWGNLLYEAKAVASTGEHTIGEDSGFCDRAKAAGARLFVDTDIVTAHVVSKKTVTWHDLKEQMDRREKIQRLAVGIWQ